MDGSQDRDFRRQSDWPRGKNPISKFSRVDGADIDEEVAGVTETSSRPKKPGRLSAWNSMAVVVEDAIKLAVYCVKSCCATSTRLTRAFPPMLALKYPPKSSAWYSSNQKLKVYCCPIAVVSCWFITLVVLGSLGLLPK